MALAQWVTRTPLLGSSVCTWCHLFGIHRGRIRGRGKSDSIH
jgi:hypothetical protein